MSSTGTPPDVEIGGRRPSLEEQAHTALVKWLVEERPPPGQTVQVRDFAARLGMSRTPVRNAVARLAERGLLSHDSSSGFHVAVPSMSSVYELFELRLMMETHSLRCFAGSASELPADDLTALMDEATELATIIPDHPERYIEFRDNDSRFHRTLVALSGLPRLQQMHDELHLNIHVTRAGLDAPMYGKRLAEAVAEHQAIVDALLQSDSDAAIAALERHILRVRDQTLIFMSRPRGPLSINPNHPS